jgi:imidazolonepropionase-like amidohydrolase
MPSANNPLCLFCEGVAGLNPGIELDYPAVLIEKGRIAALGSEARQPGASVQELPGLWLSPAPLDAHAHLWLGGSSEDNLCATWRYGVAALRDLGNPPRHGICGYNGSRPLVVTSGPGISASGPAKSWLAEPKSGGAEFKAAVKNRISRGVDVIKVFSTGLLDFDNIGKVQHSRAVNQDELGAAVNTAHQAGLSLAVHASGGAACKDALTVEVDSIEHGYFMGPDILARLAKANTAWVPTLAAVLAHAEDAQGRHSQQIRHNLYEIAKIQAKAMRQAQDLGANLVLGTDAGSYGLPHGRAVFLEIKAWLEAGIRPDVVFEAVTSRAAGLMGLAGQLGSITPGARAWLLACPDDPRQNPLSLAKYTWRSF